MLGSYASGHSLHVRVTQTLRLRGTPRGGINRCILQQYTATLSNDGAKLLLLIEAIVGFFPTFVH